jgi:hypothetical protein
MKKYLILVPLIVVALVLAITNGQIKKSNKEYFNSRYNALKDQTLYVTATLDKLSKSNNNYVDTDAELDALLDAIVLSMDSYRGTMVRLLDYKTFEVLSEPLVYEDIEVDMFNELKLTPQFAVFRRHVAAGQRQGSFEVTGSKKDTMKVFWEVIPSMHGRYIIISAVSTEYTSLENLSNIIIIMMAFICICLVCSTYMNVYLYKKDRQ